MPSVSEVTLALAALADPAQREVAHRAAIWQAGTWIVQAQRGANDANSRVVV